ncbi:hypothetical protein CMUST_06600 [Corynebacterium mustelae]|uniref:Uncharacterized protein n=1 Tax=Corynebacterium mustelae TaxID=571915 RepID=A0A0G3GYR9_9CORY|nr:hypothetical protein [Corynebacterium mustelae]AKK05655.1 hypothetical protein CMUST_06600 [Corynebacterium mustelae]
MSFLPITFVFLGIIPSFFYIHHYQKHREEELKNLQFGGWYFIFELTLSFTVGLIPGGLLSAIFFPDFWLAAEKIPRLITAVFFTVSGLIIADWFRFNGYSLPLKTGTFLPFLREISGKNPYPNSENNRLENRKPTRLFIGCGLSLFIAVFTLVILLWLWITQTNFA